jgi:protein-tyrosine-phosphatase
MSTYPTKANDDTTSSTSRSEIVLFVCQHGAAKSLIAAEYFKRLATERGLAFDARSSGLEPYTAVPDVVVAGLAREGFDVRQNQPQKVEPEEVAAAAYVVSFTCELSHTTSRTDIEQWDDVPMVSDGFDHARDVIVARVSQLVDRLASQYGRRRSTEL